MRQRFKLETETVARLDHPQIVPIYGVAGWSLKMSILGGQCSVTIAMNPAAANATTIIVRVTEAF